MPEHLIPPSFLFRFEVPCRRKKILWSPKGGELEEEYRLPNLAELNERPSFVEARAAWSPEGLAFVFEIRGKRLPPWCRESRIEDSDGVQVWIDTRDTRNIHRGTRFCHRFAFLPTGGGPRQADPVAAQLLVNRARENARPAPVRALRIRAEKRIDGYLLECLISAEALTGFNPAENSRLGFAYAVLDRELGLQIFGVDASFSFDDDPSLWSTLELIEGE